MRTHEKVSSTPSERRALSTPVSETNEREGTSIAGRNVADNLTAPANKNNRSMRAVFLLLQASNYDTLKEVKYYYSYKIALELISQQKRLCFRIKI